MYGVQVTKKVAILLKVNVFPTAVISFVAGLGLLSSVGFTDGSNQTTTLGLGVMLQGRNGIQTDVKAG